MARLHQTGRACRAGFTLIELLVVVTLSIVLLSLVVLLGPRFTNSQRVISSADSVSGWLVIAKTQAQRDAAPRGVRFLLNPQNMCTEAQYVEVPEAFTPNPAQESNPQGGRIVFAYQLNTAGTAVTSRQVYYVVTGPTPALAASALTEFDQRVAAGDWLRLPEFGMSFQLSPTNPMTLPANPSVPTATPLVMSLTAGGPQTVIPATNTRLLTLVSSPDLTASGSGTTTVPGGFQGTLTTYKFGFQGQARPVVGEPVLQLTSGTVIDFRPGDPTLGPKGDADGYRTWNTPGTTFNAAPYNPPTTVGVTPRNDGAGNFYLEVLFSPSGRVLDNPHGLVCFWVRSAEREELNDAAKNRHPRLDAAGNCDSSRQHESIGEQTLVVVSTRSGQISRQPVNSPPANDPPTIPVPAAAALGYDPYRFAKDGQNSGL